MNRGPVLFVFVVILVSLGVPALIIAPALYFPISLPDFMYLAGRYFGRVAVHRTLGFLSILLVSLHPILILVAYTVDDIPLILTLPMGAGFLSLILLFIISGSTFLGRIWRVRYESWKRLHWLTFPVVTFLFLHSIALGSDLYGVNRIIWWVLYGFHAAVQVSPLCGGGITENQTGTFRISSVKTERQTGVLSHSIICGIVNYEDSRHCPCCFGKGSGRRSAEKCPDTQCLYGKN